MSSQHEPSRARAIADRFAWIVALAIVAATIIANHHWMHQNGFFARPPSNDSSWYRYDAWRLGRTFAEDGFLAWLRGAWGLQGAHPPFVPASMGLVLGITNTNSAEPKEIFYYSAAFGALFVFAAYRLARRFVSPAAANWVAVMTAMTPGTLVFARAFDPQLPMAAFTVLAIDAAVASDGFTKRCATIAAGLFAALALQAKMLAPLYLVGPFLAALILGLRTSDKKKVLVNVLFGIAALLPGILFWYPANWRFVMRYTADVTGEAGQSFYSRAAADGPLARWLYYPRIAIDEAFGFWLGVPVAITVIVLAVVMIRTRVRRVPLDPAAWSAIIVLASPLAAYVPLTIGQVGAGALYVLTFIPLGLLAVAIAVTKSPRPLLAAVIACATSAGAGLVLAQSLRSIEHDVPGPRFLGLTVNARTDSRCGDPARGVGASSNPAGEDWGAVAFADRMTADRPAGVRYGYFGFTDQPFLTAATLRYEAGRLGRELRPVNLLPFRMPKTLELWTLVRHADFVIIGQRQINQWKRGMRAEDVVRALATAGVDLVELMRRDPTPKADLHLLQVQWPRTRSTEAVAESVLGDPRVVAASVPLAPGIVFRGHRSRLFPGGNLVLTAYLSVDAAAQKSAALLISPTGKRARWATLPFSGAVLDPAHPLLAVTSDDLELPAGTGSVSVTLEALTDRTLAPLDGGSAHTLTIERRW